MTVIGSGASAAQVIPAIVDQVKALHVFQRTPHWVMPRHDKTCSRLEMRVIGFKYAKTLLNLVARSRTVQPSRA